MGFGGISVQAVDRVWNMAGDGMWTNTTRWSPAGTPVAADRAIFNTNGVNGSEVVYLV